MVAVDFHCTTVGQKKKESGRFPQLQPFTYLSITHVKVQHKVFAHFGCQLRRLSPPPPRNVRPCSCHCGIVYLCFLSPFLTRGDRQNASQTFFLSAFYPRAHRPANAAALRPASRGAIVLTKKNEKKPLPPRKSCRPPLDVTMTTLTLPVRRLL